MTKATRAQVEAKVARVFPNRDAVEVLAQLDRYGAADGDREPARVHLAILKLCDEEGRPDPGHYVTAAKGDYRDILAWAESPNLMSHGPGGDGQERQRLMQLDRKQYDDWLAT